MTPAEGAALLRLRAMRERRAQVALLAARRAEREAVALRADAEQARAAFATTARRQRQAVHDRLERDKGLGGAALQSVAVRLAELRMQENEMAASVRQAVIAEAGQRAGAESAAGRHAATQRATEALQALVDEVCAVAAAAAERAEEAELEEPRVRL